ncbi:MAG: hypothetical protein VX762_05135 [Bacteroidota bacterium]|nr:hypothetical protein [Bacteroidota bacterium]
MSLNIGKHSVKEINEVRCTIVEKGCTKERIKFLTSLLNFNNFEVQVEEDKRKTDEDPITFTIGVTNVVFNHVIWVYQRKLKTPGGQKVTPDYWNQKTKTLDPNYWDKKSKI